MLALTRGVRTRAGERCAVKWVKRVALWLVAAFAVYYLVTDPQGSGDAVRGAWNGLLTAGTSVLSFFDSVASG